MKAAAAGLVFALLVPAAARAQHTAKPAEKAPHASHGVVKGGSNSKSSGKAKAKARRKPTSTRTRSGGGISPERAKAIEKALANVGYLSTVSGYWNESARLAMKKFQAEHHWQTRFVPDARALIALGLGPEGDHVPQIAAPVDVGGG